MDTTTDDPPSNVLPSIPEEVRAVATVPKHATTRRRAAFWSGALAVPAATALGTILKSRRAGLIAGGLAALGLGALRWQLARWFEDSPAYETIGRLGPLEVRHYPRRIEARTAVAASEIDDALDLGVGRLVGYVDGANFEQEKLPMTTPVVTMMHDGVYATSLVMPPHRPIASLPHPEDARIELREVPEFRIAVLPFRGRFTPENISKHERQFVHSLVDAGLVARGSVGFACYDSPTTLPFLRRNELWIELA